MNRLDKLIKQARKHGYGKCKYILCYLDYDSESKKYRLAARLWDGRKGMGTRCICSEHDSKEEAMNEYNSVAAKYKDAEKCMCFVDEFTFPEWCEDEEA